MQTRGVPISLPQKSVQLMGEKHFVEETQEETSRWIIQSWNRKNE